MPGSTFQTNPFDLDKLLEDCHHGGLQLPDFQRSWVWGRGPHQEPHRFSLAGLSRWRADDAGDGRPGELQAQAS